MKIALFFLILTVLGFAADNKGQKGVSNFNIQLRYSNNPDWEEIGTLSIDQNLQYKQAYVKLNSNEDYVIQWDQIDITQTEFALLKFTDQENPDNQYLSNIDLTQKEKVLSGISTGGKKKRRPLQVQEILQLVTNIDERVVAINYTVRKSDDLETTAIQGVFSESLEAIPVHFIPGQGPKQTGQKPGEQAAPGQPGQQTQEEGQQAGGILGFVKKYFWYIVIGLGVFMMLSNVDPEKVNEQVQQQQGGAAAGRQRRR